MFADKRSRRVLFAAHCVLNQNSISDGTADYPCAHVEVVRALMDAQVGIVQLPCPELCCLGLDRGNALGAESPVVVENTRIRRAMGEPAAAAHMAALVEQVMWQIRQYHKHGFEILGIVGVNRSPCCGVETTSDHGQEIEGQGVFIAALQAALEKAGLSIPVIGIKSNAEAVERVQALL